MDEYTKLDSIKLADEYVLNESFIAIMQKNLACDKLSRFHVKELSFEQFGKGKYAAINYDKKTGVLLEAYLAKIESENYKYIIRGKHSDFASKTSEVYNDIWLDNIVKSSEKFIEKYTNCLINAYLNHLYYRHRVTSFFRRKIPMKRYSYLLLVFNDISFCYTGGIPLQIIIALKMIQKDKLNNSSDRLGYVWIVLKQYNISTKNDVYISNIVNLSESIDLQLTKAGLLPKINEFDQYLNLLGTKISGEEFQIVLDNYNSQIQELITGSYEAQEINDDYLHYYISIQRLIIEKIGETDKYNLNLNNNEYQL